MGLDCQKNHWFIKVSIPKPKDWKTICKRHFLLESPLLFRILRLCRFCCGGYWRLSSWVKLLKLLNHQYICRKKQKVQLYARRVCVMTSHKDGIFGFVAEKKRKVRVFWEPNPSTHRQWLLHQDFRGVFGSSRHDKWGTQARRVENWEFFGTPPGPQVALCQDQAWECWKWKDGKKYHGFQETKTFNQTIDKLLQKAMYQSNHFILCWWFCQLIPIACGCREIIFPGKCCKHSQAQYDIPRSPRPVLWHYTAFSRYGRKTNSWLVVLKQKLDST